MEVKYSKGPFRAIKEYMLINPCLVPQKCQTINPFTKQEFHNILSPSNIKDEIGEKMIVIDKKEIKTKKD